MFLQPLRVINKGWESIFEVESMKRDEATKLIREIEEECREIRGSDILLKESIESKIDAIDYQVQIKMKTDWKRMQCLEIIVAQYGYIVKNEPEKSQIIIYNLTEQDRIKKDTPNTVATGLM